MLLHSFSLTIARPQQLTISLFWECTVKSHPNGLIMGSFFSLDIYLTYVPVLTIKMDCKTSSCYFNNFLYVFPHFQYVSLLYGKQFCP